MKSACDPSQTLLPVNGTCSASHPNSSVEQEDKSKGSSFVLPDLNLPFDDDISSGILYGVSWEESDVNQDSFSTNQVEVRSPVALLLNNT